MAMKRAKFDGKSLLKEWMDSKEWTDELEVDEEKSMSRLATGITVNGQSWKLFVEAFDEMELVFVYLYPPIRVKGGKRAEMLILLNEINRRVEQGRFSLDNDGDIQYRHRVDFEGAVPSGLSIQLMVQPAWDWCEEYADVMAAVALTKQSTEDALAELDAQTEESDDVPDAL